MSFDAVVSLALPDLKLHLSEGNSQSLRDLRAYLGLGSGGTKEENRGLIYDHIEKQRHMQAGLQPAIDVSIPKPDQLSGNDPWKGAKYKKGSDTPSATKDLSKSEIKKPHFGKSRGNIDKIRKIADGTDIVTKTESPDAQPAGQRNFWYHRIVLVLKCIFLQNQKI